MHYFVPATYIWTYVHMYILQYNWCVYKITTIFTTKVINVKFGAKLASYHRGTLSFLSRSIFLGIYYKSGNLVLWFFGASKKIYENNFWWKYVCTVYEFQTAKNASIAICIVNRSRRLCQSTSSACHLMFSFTSIANMICGTGY